MSLSDAGVFDSGNNKMTESDLTEMHGAEITVEESQLVDGWHVAMIIIGVTITLPAFLVGASIMSSVGTRAGIAAILTGDLIISLVGMAAMYIAVTRRQNTYQILTTSFGRNGSRIISFVIALTLLGWFGVTVAFFAEAVSKAFMELTGFLIPVQVCIVIGCGLMISTTIYGFRAMDILSKFTVPLMFVILLGGVIAVASDYSPREIWFARPQETSAGFGDMVSMIVGALMVGVTIVPDLARFIRRPIQVVTASGGGYVVASSVVLVLAGLPVLMTGQASLIDNMFAVGFGVPALVMMIFASWTTNVSNLYSSCLGFSQAIPSITGKRLTIFAGILGGVFALSGIMMHMTGFLVFLGIFIPPVAGIYICHFLTRLPGTTKSVSPVAMLAWGLSAGISFYLLRSGMSLTFVPALDSLLLAMISYFFISKAAGVLLRVQPGAGF